MAFIEGSVLFSIGAAAAMFHNLDEWQEKALVTCAYFAGSLAFTTGAYLGFFEVINVGREEIRFWARSGSSTLGYYGSLCYFLGALCFNVNTVAFLFLPAWPDELAYQWCVPWLAGTVGSAFFTVAAIIEIIHNAKATWHELVWWLCAFYLAGSVLYLVAAAASFPKRGFSDALEDVLVNGMYLAGSLCFLLGAWVAMFMWKTEQFGLGFIKEINDESYNRRENAVSPMNDAGSGRLPAPERAVDWKQQIFLSVYVLLGTTSAIDICHAVSKPVGASTISTVYNVISSVSNFLAAHAILWLATIVHRTPMMHPYGYLLWFMRVIATVALCSSCMRLAAFYSDDVVPLECPNGTAF